jgi:3-phytase
VNLSSDSARALFRRISTRQANVAVAVLFILVAVAIFATRGFSAQEFRVPATVETEPVPSTGDAADDLSVWIHPQHTTLSTIIGSDKDRGLAVYNLSGKELQFLPDGQVNNVDLRYGFPLGGQSVALVTAGNRTDGSIALYKVNRRTRMLEDIAARKVITVAPYGSCMYRSPLNGKYYFVVNSKAGFVEQWELYATESGKVDAKKVRSFDIGFQTEGCVADDELEHLYIGLEDHGIRKYEAEATAGTNYVMVDKTSAQGPLTPDVEGLAIYHGKDHSGYLIASSQGSNSFGVYERAGNNDYVMNFTVVAGNGIDRVTHTDGIDVVSASLRPAFPMGLFVVQDNLNDGGNQNFKLVSWQLITDALHSPSLAASRSE